MNKQFDQITRQIAKQKGSVIIICLMLLMGLSLIAVSAMKVSNLNMKIIQNHTLKEEARYKVLQALEQMLSDPAHFNMKSQTITIDGTDVEFNKQCIAGMPVKGSSVTNEITFLESTWEIIATAIDGEVEVGVLQGVEMEILDGDHC